MEASYHRHDISGEVWTLLEPHLPGQRGQWGGIAQDNRRFINAVFLLCVFFINTFWSKRTKSIYKQKTLFFGVAFCLLLYLDLL